MIILLDMGGVVADFVGPLLEQYNHLTGENVKMSDIHGPKTSKYVGDPYTLKQIKDSVGFIRNLPPISGAIDAIRQLVKDGHKLAFVSNGTNCPTSGHEKRDWLKFYFSKVWQFPPLILAHANLKSWVRGDVLLEDTSKNLDNLHPTTKGLIFHQKYNANDIKHERIYDWSHFLDWVETNRKDYDY